MGQGPQGCVQYRPGPGVRSEKLADGALCIRGEGTGGWLSLQDTPHLRLQHLSEQQGA